MSLSRPNKSSHLDPLASRLPLHVTPAKQSSAQQLELLELEMRARAIKALMKA
ncbi:hypothetical protein M9458_054806, partial [Cirrhinus mrigala]